MMELADVLNLGVALQEGTGSSGPAIEQGAAAALGIGLAALGSGYAERGIGAAAIGALAEGRVTNDAAFVGGVTALFGYSTLAAFTGFDGTVHYDLVAYAVVAVTLWTHFGVDDPATDPTTADEPVPEAASEADEEPIALTDGGR